MTTILAPRPHDHKNQFFACVSHHIIQNVVHICHEVTIIPWRVGFARYGRRGVRLSPGGPPTDAVCCPFAISPLAILHDCSTTRCSSTSSPKSGSHAEWEGARVLNAFHWCAKHYDTDAQNLLGHHNWCGCLYVRARGAEGLLGYISEDVRVHM